MTNALPILMSHFPDLGNWEANIQNNAERIVQGKHRRTRSVRPALTMILRFPFKTGITRPTYYIQDGSGIAILARKRCQVRMTSL